MAFSRRIIYLKYNNRSLITQTFGMHYEFHIYNSNNIDWILQRTAFAKFFRRT